MVTFANICKYSHVSKSKFLDQVIFSERTFPKYSNVPFISKGAKIGGVWKTKSYLEELNDEYLIENLHEDLYANSFENLYKNSYDHPKLHT